MSREDQIPPEILTAVRRYVKDRLRVSLSYSDGTQKNQDALQLVNDILLHFFADRDRAEEPVAYAVGIARRRVQDYFGATRISYTKLQDRLRYYLKNVQGFGVWPDATGEMLCGFVAWAARKHPRADSAQIQQAKASPQIMKLPALPTGDIDLLDREHWRELIEGILSYFDKVVPFADFARIASVVLQITEHIHESISGETDGEDGLPGRQIASPSPGAQRVLETRQLLTQMWREIQALLPRQRTAYLLNPPDDDTEILINSGVASPSAVREAIGLTRDQFQVLWVELIDEQERPAVLSQVEAGEDDDHFGLLRSYLPIEDLIIARLLACTRNQVIGLRNCARRRLQRRLLAFRSG